MPDRVCEPKALKSCPFCGCSGEALDKLWPCQYQVAPDCEEESEWYVLCDVCWAHGPFEPSEAQARSAWNRREAPDA